MKKIKSLFVNKIVNEDLEIIHKSLVIAHQHYASKEKYIDALKITKVIYENLLVYPPEKACFQQC